MEIEPYWIILFYDDKDQLINQFILIAEPTIEKLKQNIESIMTNVISEEQRRKIVYFKVEERYWIVK